MKKVLLVEDDRYIRRACETSLRNAGFTVLAATDGVEALKLVRSENPDIVLLDLLIPRVSGLEVLRVLRNTDAMRPVPVLILSNSSRDQDLSEARSLGIVGYYVKANLTLDQLGKTVSEALERTT
jgi:CheY-like chemotaxis protein